MSTLYISERYLKVGGSDAADGLTFETAWGTIAFALASINALSGTYRLNICSGTYSPASTLSFSNTSEGTIIRGIPSDGTFPEAISENASEVKDATYLNTPFRVITDGSYVYVLNSVGSYGFSVIDISDPTNMTRTGSIASYPYQDSDSNQDMAVSGNYVYHVGDLGWKLCICYCISVFGCHRYNNSNIAIDCLYIFCCVAVGYGIIRFIWCKYFWRLFIRNRSDGQGHGYFRYLHSNLSFCSEFFY